MMTARVESREVVIPAGEAALPGTLSLPGSMRGVVLFAHGSGSSRYSPRNRFVAGALTDAGFATLLFDLLIESEAEDRRNVFDIELLASRLLAAIRWTRRNPATCAAPLGIFGASTGAAAALVAAARDHGVRAVVSRGGRPDLAGGWLVRVDSPTLLIVGGRDEEVLRLNRQAMAKLECETRLSIVPGATHLFEEPGALEEAAAMARDWFLAHLRQEATDAAHSI